MTTQLAGGVDTGRVSLHRTSDRLASGQQIGRATIGSTSTSGKAWMAQFQVLAGWSSIAIWKLARGVLYAQNDAAVVEPGAHSSAGCCLSRCLPW